MKCIAVALNRSLVSGNIGIPRYLIHSCQWPAYTTHVSPMVKMFVEQDKLKIAKFLGTSRGSRSEGTQADIPPRKPSHLPEKADVAAEPSPPLSQFGNLASPFGIGKDLPASYGSPGVPSSFSPSGPLGTENLVIFSRRRTPLRVLPMKLPYDATSSREETASLQE